MVNNVKNNEIDNIIYDIKVIEYQIKFFKRKRLLLFTKKKLNICDQRINGLEVVRDYLLKKLEFKINE